MSHSEYNKPFLTIDQQVARLVDRGMHVADHDRAADTLRRIGYYRLSGYCHLFRELPSQALRDGAEVRGEASAGGSNADALRETDPEAGSVPTHDAVPDGSGALDDSTDVANTTVIHPGPRRLEKRLSTFMPGTTLEQVERIYQFDRTLRMHVFDALEIIEISLRARIGYLVGQGHAFAHRDPRHLHSDFTGHGRHREGMEYSSWLDSNHAEWLREAYCATARQVTTSRCRQCGSGRAGRVPARAGACAGGQRSRANRPPHR